ncbi:hypothetical protein JCM16303_002355 [Sporobolomyces ruberrimus]
MNNPFGAQPKSIVDQTAERFPAVAYEGAQSPYGQAQQAPSSQIQPQYTGYQPSYPQQQQQYYPQQQLQQQFQQLAPQNTGFQNQQFQNQPFQGYGGGSQQPSYGGQQYQPGNYGGQNTSDLDPYASLGNLTSQPSSSNSNNQSSSTAILQVQQTQSHPRQFVQENKAGLMSWDEYSWKQLFLRVDALREAWESRVAGIKAAGNQGGDPTSVDQLRRDAESNVDSIHAAKMQMSEVKSGWKHSTDPASKSRVREALNAGLNAMPEYPQPINPEQLGGSFHRNATQQYQKSSIMSQFGGGGGGGQGFGGGYYDQNSGMQPQHTGYGGYNAGGGSGMMQPQMTGYGYGGGGYPQQQQQPGGYGQQQYY